MHGSAQNRLGLGRMLQLHLRVAEIRERRRMHRLVLNLFPELLRSLLVPTLLPQQIAQAKMHVWLRRSCFLRRLKFRDRLFRLIHPIQRFTGQHVRLRGVRIHEEDLLVLVQNAVVLLRVEAALRQYATHFHVLRRLLHRCAQIRDSLSVVSASVITHAQQDAGLRIAGRRRERLFQRRDRLIELALLEQREPEVQLQAGNARIQLQRCAVGRYCVRIFALPRQIQPEAGPCHGIPGIALGEAAPGLRRLRKAPLLIERHRQLCCSRFLGLTRLRQHRATARADRPSQHQLPSRTRQYRQAEPSEHH